MATSETKKTMTEPAPGTLLGALELGGSKALCAVGSAQEVHAEARIATTTPAQTLAEVLAFFRAHQRDLSGVGIASFGPLELTPGAPGYGSLLATPKPGWAHVPLGSTLASALAVPVHIDTDVNAAARAEQQLGAGQGQDPLVYITVGTGVGVGVSSAGRPLHGLLHPELGHLQAPAFCDFTGVCPFHGRCLEGLVSAPALRARTGRAPEALADDDPVWALTARYLGHLLATIVLAHAPRRIVLGGGMLSRSGLLERARGELVTQLAGYIPRAELTAAGVVDYVRPPYFGQRAGLVGAFLLAEAAAHEH
jgi:fructokinase